MAVEAIVWRKSQEWKEGKGTVLRRPSTYAEVELQTVSQRGEAVVFKSAVKGPQSGQVDGGWREASA